MTSSLRVITVLIFYVGNETQVVVEFSPYQKIPTEKSKADNRIATIEEGVPRGSVFPPRYLHEGNADEDYLSFAKSLESNNPKPFDEETLEHLSPC